MNQRSSKLVKIFLSCLMGIIVFTGCATIDQAIEPVVDTPSEPEVEKTELELLAEEYEFLAWYLDDATTKTVDGVKYDLAALKQEYGDLYRFVEPLSKEEVEYRFQYLAEFFANQTEMGVDVGNYGGINSKLQSDEIDSIFSNKIRTYYEKLYKKEFDDSLDKYSNYYKYLEKTQNYYEDIPDTMKVNDSYDPYSLFKIINSIPFEDKDWFLRSYTFKMDNLFKIYVDLDVTPSFNISLSSKTK